MQALDGVRKPLGTSKYKSVDLSKCKNDAKQCFNPDWPQNIEKNPGEPFDKLKKRTHQKYAINF